MTATEIIECEATPTVRALHASPNAPAVNIIVNGAAALTDVPYGAGSGFVPVVESNNIQVEAITPDGAGSKIPAIELLGLDFTAGGAVLNVIARDLVAGGLDPAPLIVDYTTVAACPTP